MITSASGYECVNVTGLSDFITGDILPVRDIRGDGSWRAKKYEDLLFLQEAYLERKAVCDESNYPVNGSEPPKPLAIDNIEFDNAVNSLGNMVLNSGPVYYSTVYIDADKSKEFAFIDTNQVTVRAALLSLGWGFTDAAQLVSGRDLSSDGVRHAFWRLKKLKRTLRTVPISSLYTCSYTYSYAGGTQDGYSRTETGDFNGTLYYTNSATPLNGSSGNLRVSFSNKSIAPLRWTATASSGRGSYCVYLCKATHTVRGGGSDVKIKLVSRTTTNSTPITNMALLTSQFASACGFPYDPSPYYSENDTYRYEVLDTAFITEHAFPAEVDSLNWNWQPSTT